MNLSAYVISPWFLLALPLVPLACWKLRKGFRLWQLSALVALILAAAGPVLVNHHGDIRQLVLIPLRLASQKDTVQKDYPQADIELYAGCPAIALADAGAKLPDNGATITLYGDLVETAGSLSAAARGLNQRGIPVILKGCPPIPPRKAELVSVDYPLTAQPGERIRVNIQLIAPNPETIRLTIADRQGRALAEHAQNLTAGTITIPLHVHAPQAGLHRYSLQLNGKAVDSLALNVLPPYRILCFGQPEHKVLNDLLEGRATLTDYAKGQPLEGYSLLLLNGSLKALSEDEQRKIVQAVNRGAGVMLMTGRSIPFRSQEVLPSFAQLFPVRYDAKLQEKIPTTSLIVIIDTSGSMGGVRMELAREVARLAINKLQSCDLAGIVEFHGNRRWAAPLQSAANTLELQRALNRLSAGGGTIILPAMQEAYHMLRNADTKLKHILVITDGGVEAGDFESLIRQMAAQDITVSTVMVARRESDFLTQLALWGNGRYYKAESRFALPELNFRQTGKQQLPPYQEGQFPVRAEQTSPLLAALDRNLTVNGILESFPLPQAEVLLSANGLPLCARRQHASADVAVFNSELGGEWTRSLNRDRSLGAMLAALLRSLPSPQTIRGALAATNLSRPGRLHVRLEGAGRRQELTAILHGARSVPRGFRLVRADDGAFHLRLQGLPAGNYSLKLPQFNQTLVLTLRERAPHSALQADQSLAANVNERSQKTMEPTCSSREVPLRGWFAALFLILMLTQILLRRLPRTARQLAAVLLLSCGLAQAGEHELAMNRAVLSQLDKNYQEAMTAYAKAAKTARTPKDQKFARSMELECARQAKQLTQLLRAWQKLAPKDPVIAALLQQERGEGDALSQARGRHPLTEAVQRRLLQGNRTAAARVIQDAIRKHAGDAEALVDLVNLAEHAAFYDLSEDLLKAAAKADPSRVWQMRIRLLQLCRSRGTSRRGLQLIQDWTRKPHKDDYPAGILTTCADFSAQFGDPKDALRLYDLDASEESVIRGAMILEDLGQDKEAWDRWMGVANHSQNPMRAKQAAGRVIALATRSRTLDKLRQITAKAADDSQDRLLFHVRVLAAAERKQELFDFLAKRHLDDMAVDFQIEFQQFNKAAKMLYELAEKNPERREEYLQRLTLVALESENRELAVKVLRELANVSSNQVAAQEFAAGVHALMGNYPQAIQYYDQCIKATPEKFELQLLKAKAMQGAGRKQEALDFFLKQLENAENPELFGVMVDGLLNLDAPHPELKKTLAKVMARMAEQPEMLFYYRLADDLADELGDWHLQRNILMRELAVAPERRNLILRRLYQTSRERAERDDELYFTRLLARMDDIQSPELYKSMSRTLAENGAYETAEQCMRTADEIEGSIQYRQELVDLSVDLQRLEDAWRINHELEILMPDKHALKATAAQIMELKGDYKQAAALNWRALELLIARSVQRKQVKGGSVAKLVKSLQPVMAAFCNQAVFSGEDYLPRIRAHCQQAESPAQRQLWQQVEDRLLALAALPDITQPLPQGKAPKRLAIRNFPGGRNNAFAAAEDIMRLPQPEALKRLEDYFKPQTKKTITDAWKDLVGNLRGEPADAITKALIKPLTKTELYPDYDFWNREPSALEIKRIFARKFFRDYTSTMTPSVLMGLSWWQKDEQDKARKMVPYAHKLFLKKDDCDYKAIRIMEELNHVYVSRPNEPRDAGIKALEQRLKDLRAQKLPPEKAIHRAILEALLLKQAGRFREQTQVLCDIWKQNATESHLLDLLRDTLRESHCWDLAADALAVNPSGQATERTVIVHAWIYGRVLCRLGRGAEAMRLYGTLPRKLAERERIANVDIPPAQRTFLIRRALSSAIRENKYLGGMSYDPLAVEDPNIRLSDLVTTFQGARELLEYLLRGTPITDRCFYPLLEGYLSLPVRAEDIARFQAPQKTIFGLLMKMLRVPSELTSSELKTLAYLAGHPDAAPETVVLIAKRLPAQLREAPLRALGKRINHIFLYTPQTLDKLTAMLPDAIQPPQALRLNWVERTVRGDDKFFLNLGLMKKNRVPAIAGILPQIIRRRQAIPYGADAALAFRPETLDQRCALHLEASMGRRPQWDAILPFFPEADQQKLLQAYRKAVQDALRRGALSVPKAKRLMP